MTAHYGWHDCKWCASSWTNETVSWVRVDYYAPPHRCECRCGDQARWQGQVS